MAAMLTCANVPGLGVLNVTTINAESAAAAGARPDTPIRTEPGRLTVYPKLPPSMSPKKSPARTDTNSNNCGSNRSCIGTTRTRASEVKRSVTVKGDPALTMPGPSQRSSAGRDGGSSGTEESSVSASLVAAVVAGGAGLSARAPSLGEGTRWAELESVAGEVGGARGGAFIDSRSSILQMKMTATKQTTTATYSVLRIVRQ